MTAISATLTVSSGKMPRPLLGMPHFSARSLSGSRGDAEVTVAMRSTGGSPTPSFAAMGALGRIRPLPTAPPAAGNR